MPDSARALPSVTVVVMAYNEVESVSEVIRELAGVLATLDADSEILVIDDGSTDGTEHVVQTLADEGHVRLCRHSPNAGLGEVYRSGFDRAAMDCVTFFPADGQFPATIIAQFLPQMAQRDLVLGYLERRDDSLVGPILSWAQRMIYRVLVGALPRFQGILMVRTAHVRSLGLRSQGRAATIVFEMLLRSVRVRARMISLPTDYRPRQHGVSKVNNLRTVMVNLRQAAKLRRVLSARPE